jgi:anaerobic ribonucleoside-triphosphate reductase activating protein
MDLTKSNLINIASIIPETQALGPGKRMVVWVQGCPLHCLGCIAPEWIPYIPAMEMTPEELLEKMNLNVIDGITFSGGEPMEQASGLAALIRLARKRKDLDLICFTGYRFERLLNNPPNKGVSDLLNEVDVLIDGPFIQSLNNSTGLRGSTNQRIIHLTDRLMGYDLVSQDRKIELTLVNDKLVFIGIPTPEILSSAEEARQEKEEIYERL